MTWLSWLVKISSCRFRETEWKDVEIRTGAWNEVEKNQSLPLCGHRGEGLRLHSSSEVIWWSTFGIVSYTNDVC